MRPVKLSIHIVGLLLPMSVLAQVAVKAAPLSEVSVDLVRRAPAAVQPLNDALMSSEVSAVVSVVHVQVGQQVKAGDLLVEFEATDYALNLQQAEANLASARAQKAQADAKLVRARKLLEDKYISPDTLLERETQKAIWDAQIETAQVAVSIARRNLDKCQVRAPFNGVVSERMAQVGSFLGPGNPLLRLVQIDRFELDAELPASIADSLTTADAIWFESRNEQWPLELLRLSPVIESERRSQRARFGFTEEAPSVGRSGEVVWHVERGLLPSNLVSQRNGALGVFINNDDVAHFIRLPGAQEGRPVVVDLAEDIEVITLGRERLQDGDTLKVSR